MTRYHKLVLRNSFHNTVVEFAPKNRQEGCVTISASRWRQMHKSLCGVRGCTCISRGMVQVDGLDEDEGLLVLGPMGERVLRLR